jgi:GDP/UDP-N,N'-diacetylbacillosamine 2-epimerase (hydrolysing)
MKKTICVVTSSRADYGLLRPVIRRLLLDGFDVRIAATGAHLSEGFGSTAKEIEADGFPVDAVIDVLQDDDSKLGMSKAIGAGIAGFAAYFEKSMPARPSCWGTGLRYSPPPQRPRWPASRLPTSTAGDDGRRGG